EISPSTDNIRFVNKSVDQSATGYTGSGDSWDNAIPELADVLKWAREQHDADNDWLENDSLRIYVAKGTYLPKYSPEDGIADAANPRDNRDKTFLLIKNIQLYGGFPDSGNPGLADRDWVVHKTSLSGDLGIPGNILDNAFHVVVSVGDVGNALLNGFNIQEGNSDYRSSNEVIVYGKDIRPENGGGIYNSSSSPVFKNMIIRENKAQRYGGGMYNEDSFPVLKNVTISRNFAQSDGG